MGNVEVSPDEELNWGGSTAELAADQVEEVMAFGTEPQNRTELKLK